MISLIENVNNIFNEIKQINNELNNKEDSIENIENIINKINQYDKGIKEIKYMLDLIENIKNNLLQQYNSKILHIKNKQLEPNSHYDNSYNIELKNITNLKKFNNKLYAKCPVITINSNQLHLVVNTPIYYISDSDEYCLKINNKIVRGNISNIIDDKNNLNKVNKCNKIYCNNSYYNKHCKFYHQNEQRNFTNYSWKYHNHNKIGKIKKKANSNVFEKFNLENTRFTGSLDKLDKDILFTNTAEKELRNKQLMHDILLYQIVYQYLEH
jgi:hypothetical protein